MSQAQPASPTGVIAATPVGALDWESFVACVEASAKVYNPPTSGVLLIKTDLAHAMITQAVVVGMPTTLLTFRGTAEIRDWITDADFHQVPSSIGRIHHGIDRSIDPIQSDLIAALADLKVTRLLIGGHSLGGGQGMEFADRLCMRSRLRGEPDPIAGVITFGQPRVGNRAYQRAYDAALYSRTFRFVYEQDIVPRVPWCLGRYVHAGQEIFLSGYPMEKPRLNPPLITKIKADIWNLFDAWRSRHWPAVLDLCLQDHHVANYVSAVHRFAGGVN